MKKKVELIKEHVDYLCDLPEDGMGFQLVEVILKDGQVLTHRTVVNSTYLLLNDDEELSVQDILSIKLEAANENNM